MSGPLAGLRVLDLGTRIAAPFCAGLLGEQGAEVIKIEQPRGGDFMREIGPFVDGGDDGGQYSLFWAVEGRGRKSVTLDLRTDDGQDLLRRLAGTADVLVENFRPGTLEQWHIGPGDLPDRLVTVRISMFGQDGPYAPRPGLDRVGIGYGGLLHLTGYADRPPVRVGVTISDYLTGVFAAQAAVSALYARDARDGGGAVIDAALYGAVLRILEWTLPAYDRLGIVRSREGNRLANSAPLDNYPTRDGKYVCIVAGSDANFSRLCKAMERLDLLDDARFTKLADRAAHGDLINGIVAEWTATLDAREIEERCVACDVPVATAYTAADIFADPHMTQRGDLVTVDDPVIGPIRQQAPFPRHVGETVAAPTGAPRLGEHTRDVLHDVLGLSYAELDALAEQGVIEMAAGPITDGLFELHDDGTITLVGGYSPSSRRFHFPRLDSCPYTGATDVETVELSPNATLWLWTAVTAAPPGYAGPVPFGFGVVELTEERLRVITRLTEADPAQLTFGQPMRLVAETLPIEGAEPAVTWAFEPVS